MEYNYLDFWKIWYSHIILTLNSINLRDKLFVHVKNTMKITLWTIRIRIETKHGWILPPPLFYITFSVYCTQSWTFSTSFSLTHLYVYLYLHFYENWLSQFIFLSALKVNTTTFMIFIDNDIDVDYLITVQNPTVLLTTLKLHYSSTLGFSRI